MNREFLDLYNRELHLLYEQAKEFGEEFPGIAERLGGLIADRMDPMITGLLQGSAFLAARVQLKLKHEFPEFTNNLMEQLTPGYLAPTPSALLAKFHPSFGDPALREGRKIPVDSYMDATYRERDRRVACRFRLRAPVTMFPFDITGAEYFASPAPLQALGLPTPPTVIAGLKLSLTCRAAQRREDEMPDAEAVKQPQTWFAGCRVGDLPVYLLGHEADAIALYEQLFGHCSGVYFRLLDEFGNPVIVPAPAECLNQVGFDGDDALFGEDHRIFTGFDLLREYFVFPRKFLGFRLERLASVMPKLRAKSIDVLFTFTEVNSRLAAAVNGAMFALYAAPAINLFEKTTDRIPINTSQHEYHIVPDRSRYLDYEPHRVLEVYAHVLGGREKIPVPPLYSGSLDTSKSESKLGYTIRRMARRRTVEEKKYGVTSDYTGTDVFLTLVDSGGIDEENAVVELSVRAMCSNRHLTEQLPVDAAGADFQLITDNTLSISCVDGPTRPREPVATQMRSRSESAYTGVVTWRLLNMLALNHLGLIEEGAGSDGRSLREVLSMFADLSDSATERKIRGVRKLSSKAVTRRLRQAGGVGIARGTEVTITFDEKAFEGSGIFLLGAVLDRFLAEYAAFNHFTQTVIASVERGEVMRWPARVGMRRPL